VAALKGAAIQINDLQRLVSNSGYRALLQAADEHRPGDLDGRANLKEAGLVDCVA
jgi:hypothetical protein